MTSDAQNQLASAAGNGRQRRLPWAAPEFRRRRDIIAAAFIVLIVAAWVFYVAAHAQSAKVQHHTASAEAYTQPGNNLAHITPAQVPEHLEQLWTAPTRTVPGSEGMAIAAAGVVTVSPDSQLQLRDAATGKVRWAYGRDAASRPLCGLVAHEGNIVAFYRSAKGCSEVLRFSASNGEYRSTRDVLSSPQPAHFTSLDSIASAGDHAVDVLRSDLVRTTIVGKVETPTRSEARKYDNCVVNSALTRKELLAVTQTCADNERYLRLFKANPEKSDQPEQLAEHRIPADANLVAIDQKMAAVFSPSSPVRGRPGELTVLDQQGKVNVYPLQAQLDTIPGSPQESTEVPLQPWTQDLPHHMTWFDGRAVHAFSPGSLAPSFSIPDAIGPGAPMASHLLLPTVKGIAVVDWNTGRVVRTIPVDRGGYRGVVQLRVVGQVVLEQRGNQVVALG